MDFGTAVCNDVSSACHTIAIYNGTPFLYSFLIYLYETY